MTDARPMIESLTLPLADHLARAIPVATDVGLARWAKLHGWDGAVDRRTVARQAALSLVLRALICHRLDANELPSIAPAHFIVVHSNSLLQNLGIAPHPSSYLDHLFPQHEKQSHL